MNQNSATEAELKQEQLAALPSMIDFFMRQVPSEQLGFAFETAIQQFVNNPASDAVIISRMSQALRGALHIHTGIRQTGPGQWSQDPNWQPDTGQTQPIPAPENQNKWQPGPDYGKPVPVPPNANQGIDGGGISGAGLPPAIYP